MMDGITCDHAAMMANQLIFWMQKKYDDFVKELAVPDMDVNQVSEPCRPARRKC